MNLKTKKVSEETGKIEGITTKIGNGYSETKDFIQPVIRLVN